MTTGRDGQPVLDVRGLTRRFGGVTAVDDVTLTVDKGESLGVIGPNGAGKTTFIGLVSGALAASAGTIQLAGRDITRLGPPARTRLGIGRTHQIPRPFGRMTVLENLLLAGRHAPGGERLSATRQRCESILDRAGLAEVAGVPAGRLPLLRRKRLELARALALRPRLLLLDEIGAGLVEHETAELIDLALDLRAEVEAMVVVEHVMDVITACCDRTVVLDFGKLIAAGPTREVLRDATVAAVYLGTAAPDQTAPARATPDQSTMDASPPAARGQRAHSGPASSRAAAPDRGSPLLTITDVHVAYGGVRALRGVSLRLHRGEVVALLGANGAGKTTLARAVSGVVPLTAGRIEFDGRRIDRLPPDRIGPLGIAHCMEGRRIFGSLTVEENLLLGAAGAAAGAVTARLAATYQTFPALAQRRSRPGTDLSGGEQQMLAIGRALMSAPRAVIFDEISLGLAPIAVDGLYAALADIRAGGVAMLLVEQNLERGLRLADRAYVLADGHIALTGTPDDIRRHPALRSLYIGEAGTDQ
jgi:ABC-type branched-subunit amino acid transport system ATPase component